jgi:serine/threonine protein kinase
MITADEPMNRGLHATHADGSREAPAAIKFAFPSGARPLDGYTIKRGVGRGGFGEVYYAVSDAGKEVAIKLIRRNLEVELRGVTHCLNLKHPNLLSLYDIKQDDQDNSWVVMEYVAGDSLEQVIQRHPHGMPPEEAVDWMQGIAAGVAYLHDHGIVHRDLKPGNIFRDEGVVKLGDYGLSKFISCSRRSGQTDSVGTVHYMAPEIANGRYGKEIDLYALGIVLYEMLTGRVPFEGESVGEVLMKHLTATADVSLLAEPYRTVVARALAKDPEVRFRSIQEFMALLPNRGFTVGHYGAVPRAAPQAEPASG